MSASVCEKKNKKNSVHREGVCMNMCLCISVCQLRFLHTHTVAASNHAKNEGERNKSNDKCCIALHLFHLTDNSHSIHVPLHSLK